MVEAYVKVNPDYHPTVWSDRIFQRHYAALLKKQWAQNLSKYTGIPLPGGASINAAAIMQDAQKELDVIEASMCAIPFEDNTFNNAIVVASYHHLSNDTERKQALDEMYRILKIDGSILIVVWAMEQPSDSKFNFIKSDEIVKWKSKKSIIYDRYYHIYKEKELVEEISRLKPEFTIIYEYLEKGNWVICLKK
jgi:SAM-dependent methyltransferase